MSRNQELRLNLACKTLCLVDCCVQFLFLRGNYPCSQLSEIPFLIAGTVPDCGGMVNNPCVFVNSLGTLENTRHLSAGCFLPKLLPVLWSWLRLGGGALRQNPDLCVTPAFGCLSSDAYSAHPLGGLKAIWCHREILHCPVATGPCSLSSALP